MRLGRVARLGAILVACSAVFISAFAATNTVATSRAERDTSTITVNQKKPQPQCNAFNVTAIVRNGAAPSAANELVLGTAGPNNPLRGQGGRDCILGGGGNDLLRGDAGNDVCIGGPGTDTFHASCETQIQ